MDWDTQHWLTANVTPIHLQCEREDVIPVCFMEQSEKAKRDALAGLRLVVSSLSLLGASSIIYSAIRRKRVCSSKVHPLFVLCIADVMLAILWTVGAILWLGRSEEMKRGWCLSVSLITIIVECAAINLTFVYALLAYIHIRKLDIGDKRPYTNGTGAVLTVGNDTEPEEKACNAWHPMRLTLVYFAAWMLPVVLVMIPFASIVGANEYNLLEHVRNCTCWCQPSFGNVIPKSVFSTNGTARYSHEFRKIRLLYGVVVSAHYLVVFVLLIVCYVKILYHIHRLKKEYSKFHGARRYGTIKIQIHQAQSQARRKVVAFIIVFILTGFSNLILSLLFTYHEASKLVEEDKNNLPLMPSRNRSPLFVFIIFYFQSLTVPMQGFLNAMVYGWTRDDFVKSVTGTDSKDVRNGRRTVSFRTERDHDQSNDDESENNNSLQHQAQLSHHSEHIHRFNNGGLSLSRSGSTNGVTHNQVLSQETDFEDTDLEDGDELQISRTISVYRV